MNRRADHALLVIALLLLIAVAIAGLFADQVAARKPPSIEDWDYTHLRFGGSVIPPAVRHRSPYCFCQDMNRDGRCDWVPQPGLLPRGE